MNLGYACLAVGVPDTSLKSCVLKNASQAKLLELIAYNLNALENIIDYNIKNNIRLFRISSDLIPFGSSVVNMVEWWNIFKPQFLGIGDKIKNNGIRVSMHPGQYTVLNSPNSDVVKRAISDLNYHTKVLDCLELGAEHKIVLHIGGIYNNKNEAMSRFIANYQYLEDSVKNRLVIENDDKCYTIKDVLEISIAIDVPVIFDNLHNEINAFDEGKSDFYWINECKKTWKEKDGTQKMHYSQQDLLKRPGSHSNTIRIDEFIEFYKRLESKDIDIMLEVKDKNLSTIKCINSTRLDKKMTFLELEWSKYKYKILENSHLDYVEIRKLLCNKNEYPAIEFYNLIENALQKESTMGDAVNAAQHIWGYFKYNASEQEKESFLNSIERYKQQKLSIKAIKHMLWKMTVKYQQEYLLNSYYFVL